LPQGYTGIQSSGGPGPRRDLSGLLEAVSGLGGAMPGVTGPAAPGDAQNGPGRPRAGGTERNPHGGKSAPAGVTGGLGKIIGTPFSGTHTIGNWQSDRAVDVRVKEGSPIRAGANGTVVKVHGSYQGGASRFDGVQVTIRTRGNQLFYTHLSGANVKPGQRVRRGQVIGRSGSANGVPHLHFGVEKGDPRRYV
jgi:murein DD-endopeptidase MepM/ murein hydrolase activator NlpD